MHLNWHSSSWPSYVIPVSTCCLLSSILFRLNSEAALFYHVCPPLHKTTPPGHFCGPCPPSKTRGLFSHHMGIIGPSSLHIHIHVDQQGHLQPHPLLLPALMICSRLSTSSPAANKLIVTPSIPPIILYLNCLSLFSVRIQPVFTQPPVMTHSCSSTCTSSSGAATPPLSISDGYSSFSEGSQSSIDLAQLNVMLANAMHPLANTAFDRMRPCVCGHGHH